MDLIINESKKKALVRFNEKLNILGDFEFIKKDIGGIL
jgi:hypothetical protein